MNVEELRAAIIQIATTLDQTVNTYEVTTAYKLASANFNALMTGSNNPMVGPTAQYLAGVAEEAFFWEGRTTEVLTRLQEFAATIQ